MTQSIIIKFLVLISSLSWVIAQEYIENLHDSKIETHYKEIPRSFELKGFDANAQFQKYFDRIQAVAVKQNLLIVYKIKVEIQKPNIKHRTRMQIVKKGKSKKYNIPLKKTSMKLSNFEVWLRKMAEQSGFKKKGHAQNNEDQATTQGERVKTTTKPILFKYKPIISRTKTNYTKFVRPVRSRIITLG